MQCRPGYSCDFFPIPLPPARVCWTLGEAQSRRVGRRGTCNSCPARQTSISPRVSSREAPHSLRPHPARVPRAKVKRRSLPRQKPETLEFTSGCPQRPVATSEHFLTRSASSHPLVSEIIRLIRGPALLQLKSLQARCLGCFTWAPKEGAARRRRSIWVLHSSSEVSEMFGYLKYQKDKAKIVSDVDANGSPNVVQGDEGASESKIAKAWCGRATSPVHKARDPSVG